MGSHSLGCRNATSGVNKSEANVSEAAGAWAADCGSHGWVLWEPDAERELGAPVKGKGQEWAWPAGGPSLDAGLTMPMPVQRAPWGKIAS